MDKKYISDISRRPPLPRSETLRGRWQSSTSSNNGGGSSGGGFSSGGGDKTYIHEQDTPSDTWQITHNLGKMPSVTVIDSGGSVCIGAVTYDSSDPMNKLTVEFTCSFSGKAILN